MGLDRQTSKSFTFELPEGSEVWYNSVAFADAAQVWSESRNLPDPCGEGSLGAINTELLKFFQRLKAIKGYGELYINGAINKVSEVTSLIRKTSSIIAAILKSLVQRTRDFLIGKIRAGIQDLIDLLLPTVAKNIKNTIIQKIIDNILCKFKDLISGLIEMVGDFLFELAAKIVNVPFCAALQWTNGLINKLASDIDRAIGPILDAINDVLGSVATVVGSVFDALNFILGFESFLCEQPNCPEIKDFKSDPFWGGPTQKDKDNFANFLPVPTDGELIQAADGWLSNLQIFGGTFGEFDGTIPDSITQCNTDPFRCGPPKIEIFGGGGFGAAANAVVDRAGKIIGTDLVNRGSGYKTPPFVSIVDNCGNGEYASAYSVIDDDGFVTDIITVDPGGGYLPGPGGTEFDPDDDDGDLDGEGGGPDGETGRIREYIICLSGFEVISTGVGYKPTDKIKLTPDIPGLEANVTITESGQILSVEVTNKVCGITEIPDVEVTSENGTGLNLKPTFDILSVSDSSNLQTGSITGEGILGGGGTTGGFCNVDSDCPPGQMCIDGRCQSISCSVDTDCPAGFVCYNGKCVDENLLNKATELKSTVIDSNLLFDSSSISATTSAGQVSVVRVVDCVE